MSDNADDATNTTTEAPPEAAAAPVPRTATVLIIEDETPVANAMSDWLTLQGCRVVIAGDGESGLELFHAENPDLVVCDLLLPKRNGFKLIEDFKATRPAMPVVVMTGIYRSEAYRNEVSHARLVFYKPLETANYEQVLEVLRSSQDSGEAAPAATPAETTGVSRRREPWLPTAVVPLSTSLQVLWRERRTGLLTHRLGERRTVFQLREGRLQFVRSNDPELRLDRVLVEMGLVDPAALEEARRHLDETVEMSRLGQVLVESGALASENLGRALQSQLRRIILRAFATSGGETLFRAEASLPEEEVTLDADLRAIMIAGALGMRDDSGSLSGHLPDEACRLVRTCELDDEALGLPTTVKHLLAAVNEPTPVGELLAMSDLAGLNARPLLHALICAGALTPEASAPEWSRPAPRSRGGETRLPADTIPLVAVRDLALREATGVLALRWRGRLVWLAFEDGHLRSAGSDDARARLGERLLHAGLLDAESLQGALEEKRKRPAVPLGRILVEQGLLTPESLHGAVEMQTRAIAREALALPAWEGATMAEGVAPPAGGLPVAVTVDSLIAETLRVMETSALSHVAGLLAADASTLDPQALGAFDDAFTAEELDAAQGLGTDALDALRRITDSDEPAHAELRALVACLLLAPMAATRCEAAQA